jgi:hypothetical protein
MSAVVTPSSAVIQQEPLIPSAPMMEKPMSFTRWVFRMAALYEFIVLLPLYGLEARIGRDTPPAITHPEYFYGFIGVALVMQLLIS